MGKEAKELFIEQIIPGTITCKLESVEGRPNTCPNNPARNAEDHIPKLCRECPQNPVSSSKNNIPNYYLKIRQSRYKKSE